MGSGHHLAVEIGLHQHDSASLTQLVTAKMVFLWRSVRAGFLVWVCSHADIEGFYTFCKRLGGWRLGGRKIEEARTNIERHA